MSGISLIKEKSDYKVLALITDSPAAQAGVQIGDAIIAVDGKPTSEM